MLCSANRPPITSQMIGNEEESGRAVLTGPLFIEDGSHTNYRAPNLIQRVLSLFAHIQPGSDVTRLQLPPQFNIPKSQLQCYGELIYWNNDDMLRRCADNESPSRRLASVLGWYISSFRSLVFGVAPLNPILGETHHVSYGSLNVFLEQVSHHPPVSALHATDEKNNIEIIWFHYLLPKFYGTTVETDLSGKRILKLLDKKENYVVLSCPRLVIRFLPMPCVEWCGDLKISCVETGLEAQVRFGGNSFLNFGGRRRSIRGKIFRSQTMDLIYEIKGRWDGTVEAEDINNRETSIIYDAKKALSGLKTPIVRNPKGVLESESAAVWANVSEGILNKCWDKARDAKSAVEGRERELVKKRNSNDETWVSNYFNVSFTDESGWDCSPKQKLVPPAPIIVPT